MQSLDTIAMHKHICRCCFFLMNFKVFLLVHNESLYIQKGNAIERNSNFLVSIPYITSYQKKNRNYKFFYATIFEWGSLNLKR